MWTLLAFKKGDRFCTFEYKEIKKTNKKGVEYHHLLSIATVGDNCHILWFENVLSELYCF